MNTQRINYLAFALVLVAILFWGCLLTFKYLSFGYYDWDLAICSQTMWSIIHGQSGLSLMQKSHFLANHVTPIAYLIAPLYLLFQHPLLLIYLQTLSLILCALVLYHLAKEEIGHFLALILLVLYLLYPALWYGLLYEFHFVSLSCIFLTLMFFYYKKDKFTNFIIFLLLALLCREEISIIIFGFGLFTLFRRRSLKWKIYPLLLGLSWFLLSIFVISPYFNRNEAYPYAYTLKNIGSTPLEVIKNLISQPLPMLKKIFVLPLNQQLFFDLFAPLSFTPVLYPPALIIILPLLLLHLLTINFAQHTIYYHYTIPLIPFLFISCIYGIKFLLSKKARTILVALLLIIGVYFSFYIGPQVKVISSIKNFSIDILDHKRNNLINLIPKNASLVATFDFLPKLSQRKNLYSFHHILLNVPLPTNIEYALLDFNSPLLINSFYRRDNKAFINKFFSSGEWGLVSAVDDLALFKKTTLSSIDLFKVKKQLSSPAKYIARVDEDIYLVDYNLISGKFRAGEVINLKFSWNKLKNSGYKEYIMAVLFLDNKNRVAYAYNHPLGYHIYPTDMWQKNDIVEENYNLLVPKLDPGRYTVKALLFDLYSSQIAQLTSNDFSNQGSLVMLGNIEILN